MNRLVMIFLAASGLTLAGCSTVDEPTAKGTAVVQKEGSPVTMTGSRIPRSTTDRVVKSTERDRADEPVRSLGNTVGTPGN
jgi:hypothetical protein